MTTKTLRKFRCRDIGYGVETGTVELPAMDGPDWTGKRPYRSVDGATVFLFDDELRGSEMTLTCDGWCNGTGTVTHIDTAGFAYCTPCGLERRMYEPCRKLRPHELRKLQRGEQLAKY